MATKEIRTEIEIEAPAERVWSIITDLPAFERWNPFIVRGEGEVAAGSKVRVTMHPPGHRRSTFKPTIVDVEPGRSYRWLGHLGPSGIFDGEHAHEVEPLGSDRCRYVQSERFQGILVPMLGAMLRDSERGFRAMNAALKKLAESSAPTAAI